MKRFHGQNDTWKAHVAQFAMPLVDVGPKKYILEGVDGWDSMILGLINWMYISQYVMLMRFSWCLCSHCLVCKKK